MNATSKNKFSTLFLDRDGVINHRVKGYISSDKDFNFIDGVVHSFSKTNILFEKIIIITNQQGIGKGLMTVSDLNMIHDQMIDTINKNGGRIDRIYYCPHLISENCECRKPKIGMFNQSKLEFPEIDFKESFFIGDSDSDMEAARLAGSKFIKVSSDYSLSDWVDSIKVD